MDIRKRQPIGVELVKRGIVTEADVEQALQYQKEHPSKKIGDILYTLGACEPTKLIQELANLLGEKGIILNQSTIKVKLTDYISLDIAKENKAIPFEVNNGRIKICFADNSKTKKRENIRLLMLNKGLVMDSYITFESDIDRILKSLEGTSREDFNIETNSDTVTNLVDSIIKTGRLKKGALQE